MATCAAGRDGQYGAGGAEGGAEVLELECSNGGVTAAGAADDVGVQLRVNSDIMFKPGSFELLPEGGKVLSSVLSLMEGYNLYLVVRGHADSTETAPPYGSAWELSGARASAMVNYLVQHGVKATRMRAVSYGDTRPLKPGIDEQSRAMNRRVEFFFHRPEVMSYSVVY